MKQDSRIEAQDLLNDFIVVVQEQAQAISSFGFGHEASLPNFEGFFDPVFKIGLKEREAIWKYKMGIRSIPYLGSFDFF